MEKHKKAADVFNDATFAFAKKSPFADAFPTIEELSIEVTETNYGQPVRTHYVSHTSGGEYVNCSNRLCYNGGISAGDMIRYMIAGHLTEHEFPLRSCQGYEGSPKGKKRYRSCVHTFTAKARIKYKEISADSVK